jgi:CRP-like cAMP-binding protein
VSDPKPQKLEIDDDAAKYLAEKLLLGAFFVEFSKDSMKGVFPHGGLFLCPQGCRLINQGEQCRDLFVLYDGKVEVVKPFAKDQIFLKPGDVFGEMALVRDGKRSASVLAAEPSKVFFLPYQDLQYVMSSNPILGKHLQDIAERRL